MITSFGLWNLFLLTRTSAGKTWIGCGLHIPYAMSLVPKELWCTCISGSGVESEYPPKFGDGVANEENELEVKIHSA